jgi:hypothetical protein
MVMPAVSPASSDTDPYNLSHRVLAAGWEVLKISKNGKRAISRGKFRLKRAFLPFSALKSGPGHQCP